jgi:methylglutaconyl-CoA hydratase
MSTYATLDLAVSADGVAVLSLDRPHHGNALNGQVVGELADAFASLARSPEARVVMLRGAGDHFCAGADPDWMRAASHYSQHDHEEDGHATAEMLRALHALPQVAIALVKGDAFGAGAGLVAACDLAIAHASARFGFPEVRHGVIAATSAPYVVQAVGARTARGLFVSGEPIDAREAQRIGLVQMVAADDAEMDALIARVVAQAMAGAPAAIADAKDLVSDVAGADIDAGISRLTARRHALRRASDTGREGIAAFLEQRTPRWKVAE